MLYDRLKICLLTSSFPCHPADRVTAPFLPPFIEALQDQGAQVVVFTQERPGDKVPVVDVPIHWFPWHHTTTPLSRLRLYHPRDLWSVGRLIIQGCREIVPFVRHHQVDLCLAAWAIPSGYFASRAHKALGVPYCVWALGSDISDWARYPLLRQGIQQILRDADGLFADGLDLGKRVQQLAGRPCAFLPTVRPLADDESVVRVVLDPGTTHFLFVGRWEKVKGVDILLEAMHRLQQAGVAAHLHIVGKGSLKGFLQRKMQAYGLTNTVFLQEDVPTAILRGYLQQCDCLVIPSRSDSIPLVFSEGLQARIPLIVSATGDLATLVQRFALGHVVPPGDAGQLTRAMADFVRNRGRKQQYLHHVDKAQALFNIDKAAATFLQHAQQLVSTRWQKPVDGLRASSPVIAADSAEAPCAMRSTRGDQCEQA
ncbi:MAG: glycosyltransferase [Candidatus Tectomicrobia bacterium]